MKIPFEDAHAAVAGSSSLFPKLEDMWLTKKSGTGHLQKQEREGQVNMIAGIEGRGRREGRKVPVCMIMKGSAPFVFAETTTRPTFAVGTTT